MNMQLFPDTTIKSDSPISHELDLVTKLRRELLRASDKNRKVALYRRYLPEIASISPWQAVAVANEAYDFILLSLPSSNLHAEADILHCRGTAYLRQHRPRAAYKDLELAHELYTRLHEADRDVEYQQKADNTAVAAGEARLRMGHYDTAGKWYEEVLTKRGHRTSELHASALQGIGELHLAVGKSNEGFKYLFSSLTMREELGDPIGIGQAQMAIGNAYSHMGDHESACTFLTKSIELFKDAGKPYFVVQGLAHKAAMYRNRKQLSDAIAEAVTAYNLHQMYGDWLNAMEMAATIGDIHEEQGEIDIAFASHMKAYQSLSKDADDILRLPILLRVGRLHQQNGDLDAALLVLAWALDIAETLGELRLQYQLHESLASLMKTLGQYQKALEHHERFAEIRHEVAGEEQQRAIAEMQIRFELERAERERDKARQHTEQLQHALADMAPRFIQKDAMLAELLKKVETLRTAKGVERDTIATEITSDIRAHLNKDEEWTRFKFQFNSAFPDFVRNLTQICSTLSPAEMKICFLAKLGYGTEETSAILGTSERTVETQRSKTRKKLNLPSELDFWMYIASI